MNQRGINRIVVGVWDLEDRKRFFEELLEAEFVDTPIEETEPFGVRVAMAFEAGIELTSPIPDTTSPLRNTLEHEGEGIIGVVFAVPDLEAAGQRAASLGLESFYALEYDQTAIDEQLGGYYTHYAERFYAMKTPIRGTVLLGEFIEKGR